jgi:hypothetical protein
MLSLPETVAEIEEKSMNPCFAQRHLDRVALRRRRRADGRRGSCAAQLLGAHQVLVLARPLDARLRMVEVGHGVVQLVLRDGLLEAHRELRAAAEVDAQLEPLEPRRDDQ